MILPKPKKKRKKEKKRKAKKYSIAQALNVLFLIYFNFVKHMLYKLETLLSSTTICTN